MNNYQPIPPIQSASLNRDLSLPIAGRFNNPGSFWIGYGRVNVNVMAARLAPFYIDDGGYISGGIWNDAVS